MFMRRDDVAARRRRVLGLYNDGLSQLAIAAELGMPRATVALDLKLSPGYTPRPTLSSFDPGARLTAAAAARTFGVDPASLRAAIDARVVRGRRHRVADGRWIRTVDPGELKHDLAHLPTCRYEGCDRRALAPSGACSGPHARALETTGKSWRTWEAIEKTAAALKGRPRPDVRERVAAMHADPHAKYAWAVRLVEGRDASPTGAISPNAKRRWKGRLEGLTAKNNHGRPRGYTEEQAATVLRLHRERGFGRGSLARATGLTEKQVRAILSRE
jgi:hypothetical protein